MVETAIMVPVFVSIFFWAAFFYDFVQLRIKVMEAARFAAWEMTAYPLTDYRNGDHQSAFSIAASGAQGATTRLYQNLNSEDDRATEPRLTVDFQLNSIDISGAEVDMVDAGPVRGLVPDATLGPVVDAVLNMVSDALGWVMGTMEFNTAGLVTAEASATVSHKLLPRGYHTDGAGGSFSNALYETTSFNIREKVSLIADGWTLHYGNDVLHEDTDNPFFAQVERGHMLNLMRNVPILDRLASVIDAVGDFIEDFFGIPSFTNARLASKNYERTRDGDEIRLDTDEAQKDFHTAPAIEVCFGGRCSYDDSKYSRTLQMRGGYYMGCPEQQHTPGKCRWGR